MKCFKCGNEIDNDARFCLHCGAQVAQPTQPVQQPSQPAQAPVYPDNNQYIDPYAGAPMSQFNAEPAKKKSPWKAIAAITAALVLLGGAGVGVGYMLFHGDSDDSPSTVSKTAKADSEDEEETEKASRTRKHKSEDEEDETKSRRETTEAETEPETEAETNSVPSVNIDSSLRTGGDTFTVASWNADDVPALIAQWKGVSESKVTSGTVSGINFVNFGVGGGQASEKYDAWFNSGEDLDVYFCEADWAYKYINDDSKTVALSKLGLNDSDFANSWAYVDSIGTDVFGERKGASWQSCPGAFAYRTDLAEQYLGVHSPSEMQSLISTWDGFVAAGVDVASASGGSVALADSVGGMWQAYSCSNFFSTSSAKTFADYAKTLWDCGGVQQCGQWTPEWTAHGYDGETMGYFVTTWAFGGYFADASSNSYGNWGLCEGPEPFFWGGTWMVVNPNTDNAEEARDFIYTSCCSEDYMESYALSKPEFVNNSVAMYNIKDQTSNFDSFVINNFGGQAIYSTLYTTASGLGIYENTPDVVSERSAMLDAITEYYLRYGYSWDEALDYYYDAISW
jgi:ABC-type glycerol-3-phosphate transport system substrate-binding protein